MPRYLRHFLILFLSLTLPLMGMASQQVSGMPCPMKEAGMSVMGDMGKDCCKDMAGAADHGSPCKPGQECKTGGMLQVTLVKPPVTVSGSPVIVFFKDFLPFSTPSGVWRPPRA